MSTTDLPGVSVWERDVYHLVSSHLEAEGSLLDQYQAIAEDPTMSPAFRFLADLILDDERRHHRLLTDLRDTLVNLAEFTGQEGPMPGLRTLRKDRERVLDLTERLLEAEKKDAQELKALRRRMKDVKDTTMWSLVVELVELDTEKHRKILKFIRDHSK